MKKLYSFLAVAMISSSAFAQDVVVNEDFSFTGALNANGWVTHSGTAGQLVSNGSAVSLVTGNSEDVNRAFTTPYVINPNVVNKVSYSATVNVPNSTGLASAGEYSLMLGGTAGTTVSTFYARLYVKSSATGYTIGILNNSGGTPTFGTEVPFGTLSNILVEFIINNSVNPSTNVATLQINTQPLVTNSSSTAALPGSLNSIAIRQATGTGNVSFDNIVVTTFNSALGINEIVNLQSAFVKNTFVEDTINFGARADVKIYSMNGQVLKSATVSENKNMNVADLAPGMYLVTGMVNGQPVSQKIMKK